MKSLIYEADKKEEFVKCSFYIDDNKAKLIHIEPKFERVKEGGEIISYVDKLEY